MFVTVGKREGSEMGQGREDWLSEEIDRLRAENEALKKERDQLAARCASYREDLIDIQGYKNDSAALQQFIDETLAEPCPPRARALLECVEALRGLVALMDSCSIEAHLGDESDRVFPHYEFEPARKALAGLEGLKQPR